MAGQAQVKENVYVGLPLAPRWVAAALLFAVGALLLAMQAGRSLPAPLPATAPSHRFRAEAALSHLINLTKIGPRVAGSYENEVAAVQYAVAAARGVADQASPHNVVEIDRMEASGAFSLSFFDGLNHVYRGVQSVLLRVRGAGGRGKRPALLINCHLDTVPDSPGASDDAAGCAVALEVARALAAGGPLQHDVVVLLNGAEENIMQASHGVIMTHPWAKAVRAFINIEACGAGGREVMFQAGPHDPWLVEVYADVVPHPFASSLAQEMFESGLIPADTDFRIFRDFGKLSGVDLAWSSNGYVYHTRLDTAERVGAAALQRTGDNVLAMARALLAGRQLDAPVDRAARPPVFFDVLGLVVVSARAPTAAVVALATLALVLLDVHLTADDARRHLFVSRAAWWRAVCAEAAGVAAACALGVAASTAVALALHAARARLAFYSHDWLLAPLYAAPALAATWLAIRRGGSAAGSARGWWRARAVQAALSCLAGALLLVSVLRGLRSGFLPLLWSLLPAAADTAAHLVKTTDGWRCVWWCLGALPASLQTWYMSADLLATLLPITGRAGSPALPPDVLVAAVVAGLVLAATSWLLPLVVAARGLDRPLWAVLAICAVVATLVASGPLYEPYSGERPQRLMVYHTQRTFHKPLNATTPEADRVEHLFWVPELDANTPHSLYPHVGNFSLARPVEAGECERWVYCGAPYYLPVLALVPRSYWLPAPGPPRAACHVDAHWRAHNHSAVELTFNITGPSHVVVIVSPAEGVRLAAAGELPAPLAAARWGQRLTYFLMLFSAPPAVRHLPLLLVRDGDGGGQGDQSESWVQVSIAGHAMSGDAAVSAAQEALLRGAPDWVAATGWGVDLHLYRL